MGGRGAAAAADQRDAVLADERAVRVAQAGGREVVDGLVVLDAGQPGVGLAEDRQRRVLGEIAQVLVHELGAGGAVDAERVDAQRHERRHGRADLGADQHLAGRLDGDRDEDRDLAAGLGAGVLRAEDRGLALQQVVDGLDQQRVGAAVEQAAGLLPVGGAEAVEVDLPQAGQLGARPHRPHDPARAAVPGRVGVGRLARQARGGGVDLVGAVGQVVLRQRDRRGAEAVGQHGVDARVEVDPVQPPHDVGVAEVEVLVAAVEAAEVVGRQAEALQAGARGAVEDDDALSRGVEQGRAWGRHWNPSSERCRPRRRVAGSACRRAPRRRRQTGIEAVLCASVRSRRRPSPPG